MATQRFFNLKRFKNKPKTVWGWLFLLMTVFVVFTILRVVSLSYFNPRQTAFMNADPLNPSNIEFVPIGEISRHLIKAVLVSEDDLFFEHEGFQWDSIKRAWKTNQKHHKNISGASTLSQQLARNLFLSRDKSWIRKIKEAGLTVLLELFLSKERILELYLNVAEMGPGIYGVGQASRYHFGVKPNHLSQVQSSLLAATLINGKIYGHKPYPSRTLTRQKKILYRMSHYALAIPDFINKTPLVVAKEEEKTITNLIKGMTDKEADEPDDPVDEEANMMMVIQPQTSDFGHEQSLPHAEQFEDVVELPVEQDNTEEKPPVFLDEE